MEIIVDQEGNRIAEGETPERIETKEFEKLFADKKEDESEQSEQTTEMTTETQTDFPETQTEIIPETVPETMPETVPEETEIQSETQTVPEETEIQSESFSETESEMQSETELIMTLEETETLEDLIIWKICLIRRRKARAKQTQRQKQKANCGLILQRCQMQRRQNYCMIRSIRKNMSAEREQNKILICMSAWKIQELQADF